MAAATDGADLRTEETVNAISCCSHTATGDEHFRCVWGKNNMDQAPNLMKWV